MPGHPALAGQARAVTAHAGHFGHRQRRAPAASLAQVVGHRLVAGADAHDLAVVADHLARRAAERNQALLFAAVAHAVEHLQRVHPAVGHHHQGALVVEAAQGRAHARQPAGGVGGRRLQRAGQGQQQQRGESPHRRRSVSASASCATTST